MNMQTIIGILLAVVVIGGGAYWYSTQDSASSMEDDAMMQDAADAAGGTMPEGGDMEDGSMVGGDAMVSGSYTLVQIAEHKDATSCWAAINGMVYDLTEWIPNHPGGPQRILSICGTDGSAAFGGKHGGQEKPETTLATFKIGTLAP